MTKLTEESAATAPWSSTGIPAWTRAPDGAVTPSGSPAVFRSSPHAWFALRLLYLAEVAEAPADVLAQHEERYRRSWDRFVRHGAEMQRLAAVIDYDLAAAAALWKAINQPEVDAAFSIVICEREPFPKTSMATLALRHYGLRAATSVAKGQRDRKLTKTDNETAWQRSVDGVCQGCGTSTISQRQYDRIRRVLAAHPEVFDLTPAYAQTNGRDAPLWSNRILIAAKGVADHIVPWSHGGPTSSDNLANVCAACNYSRSNTSLDAVRVAAYT